MLNTAEDGKWEGIDGCTVEYLRKRRVTEIECLVRLINAFYMTRRVPKDWHDACILLMYKGKGITVRLEILGV